MLLLIYAGIQTERASRFKIGKRLAENERDQAINFASEEKRETESFRNKNGNLTQRMQELTLSLANVNKLKDTDRLKFLNEIDRLKKDLRNLENAGKIDVRIDIDSIPFTPKFIPCDDSLKVFRYYYHDEFNLIDALVIDTPVYKSRVPIFTADYWDRKWFLGKKMYWREVTSPNKKVDIELQEYFTVTRKSRRERKN
jgi:hypothetical protein